MVQAQQPQASPPSQPKRRRPGQDWKAWPQYDAAKLGLRGYWYPVTWSSKVTGTPQRHTLCGEKLVLIRDGGEVYALADRCPHRGVPLSLGRQEFPGTLTCAYHGWTFDLQSGELCAVLTDGPTSPICGKVVQKTHPVEERHGIVWVYLGDGEEPHPLDEQLPEEWRDGSFVLGGSMQDRRGDWRYACENGFDEGHAKYLHRTSLWRLFRTMPTWNITSIERQGRWIHRVQKEVHFRDEHPGLGVWTNYRWWKKKPPERVFNIGNVGDLGKPVHPVIGRQEFPGYTSISVPGVLRVVYPDFIHYEWWVPTEPGHHRYVGIMIQYREGLKTLPFYLKYFGGIRWFFHGQFSQQDEWMVGETDAPPERLYRPDASLTAWRKLVEETTTTHEAARAAKARRQDYDV
jgi:phenylpropionate dioxygenase-like ring-hydroxylating dioxygenase large terminal subunit